ncbi:unnamed protein product [Rodentolepis nana]|uniref:Transporter n=1 Tax=Rodentolepis nana TaxID=102285 RepID=A0A0R3T7R1_RODNA|nr:unnamed protein product [Rodentolepis nana]
MSAIRSLCCKPKEKDPKEEEEKVERSEWSKPIQFILSIIGYAVGLGNIWRFPYLVLTNGGGAFLVPYITFMLFCGIPFCFMEFTLGQFSGLSPVEAFGFAPLFRGLGWAMLLVSGMLCIYYNIVMAWVVFYFTQSFSWNLPWKSCNNSWNTPNCFTYTGMTNMSSIPPNSTSSTMEFWNHRVLETSPDISDFGGINWHLCACMAAAWVLTFLCLYKGIKTSGKVVYVTALIPYVFLTILVARGVTLPGADIGLNFYIKADWKQLKSITIWTRAAVQVFYSLGPAWGGLITMSSYNRYNRKFNWDAFILPIVCGGTSIFGGFAVFPIVGHMAYQMGSTNVSALMNTGPGLAFIVYPEALAQIPGAPIFTVCFFAMLFTLGLDSQFATLETMTSGFMDRFPNTIGRHKTLFTLIVCIVQFFLGFVLVTRAGGYWFQIFDWYATPISIVLIATLEVIAISYVYGARRMLGHAETMIGKQSKFARLFWTTIWYFITPCFTFYLFVTVILDYSPPYFTNGKPFPSWSVAFGWCIASISMIPIPLYAIREIWKRRHNLKSLIQPMEYWTLACEARFRQALLRKARVEDMELGDAGGVAQE